MLPCVAAIASASRSSSRAAKRRNVSSRPRNVDQRKPSTLRSTRPPISASSTLSQIVLSHGARQHAPQQTNRGRYQRVDQPFADPIRLRSQPKRFRRFLLRQCNFEQARRGRAHGCGQRVRALLLPRQYCLDRSTELSGEFGQLCLKEIGQCGVQTALDRSAVHDAAIILHVSLHKSGKPTLRLLA